MSQRGTQGTQGTVFDQMVFMYERYETYPVGVEKIFHLVQNAALRPLRPPVISVDNRNRGAQPADRRAEFSGALRKAEPCTAGAV